MKKITLLAAVLVAVSFASCKKAAKCECTTTSSTTKNGIPQTTSPYVSNSQVTTTEISKTSKKTAAAMCGNTTDVATRTESYPGTSTDVYVTTTSSTCSIK